LAGQQKGIMSRQPGQGINKILIEHWRWLEVNGYKRQAASCKQQALNLTRKLYNNIPSYKIKENKK